MIAAATQPQNADSGERRSAGGGRIDGAALNGHAGRVGLELEQRWIARQAAIDAEHIDWDGLTDHAHNVGDAPCDRLQRRACEMRWSSARGQTADHAAGFRPPPRRSHSGECRQHTDPARVLDSSGRDRERGWIICEPKIPAQPLEQRPSGEDASIDCPFDPTADAPGDRRYEAPAGLGALGAGVGKHEHAGSVGRFDEARPDAPRACKRRLLIHAACTKRQLARPGRMR